MDRNSAMAAGGLLILAVLCVGAYGIHDHIVNDKANGSSLVMMGAPETVDAQAKAATNVTIVIQGDKYLVDGAQCSLKDVVQAASVAKTYSLVLKPDAQVETVKALEVAFQRASIDTSLFAHMF